MEKWLSGLVAVAMAFAVQVAGAAGAAGAAGSAEATASDRLPPSAARRLRDYLETPLGRGYRAFAVGPDARHWAAGQADSRPATAMLLALSACAKRAGRDCRVHAVGNIIVQGLDARRRDIATILYQVRRQATNADLDALVAGRAGAGGDGALRRDVFYTGAIMGNTSAVAAMLDTGVAVDARSDAGVTALLYAASRGRAEVVRLLLARGADVNARNSVGKTALSMALHAKSFVQQRNYRTDEHEAVIRLLREAGGVE